MYVWHLNSCWNPSSDMVKMSHAPRVCFRLVCFSSLNTPRQQLFFFVPSSTKCTISASWRGSKVYKSFHFFHFLFPEETVWPSSASKIMPFHFSPSDPQTNGSENLCHCLHFQIRIFSMNQFKQYLHMPCTQHHVQPSVDISTCSDLDSPSAGATLSSTVAFSKENITWHVFPFHLSTTRVLSILLQSSTSI